MAEKAEGRLYTKEYTTLNRVAGPLIFVERLQDVAYGEIVEIYTPDGQLRLGQVLEVDGRRGIIQVFAGTQGLDLERTRVRFTGDVARVDVSIQSNRMSRAVSRQTSIIVFQPRGGVN